MNGCLFVKAQRLIKNVCLNSNFIKKILPYDTQTGVTLQIFLIFQLKIVSVDREKIFINSKPIIKVSLQKVLKSNMVP